MGASIRAPTVYSVTGTLHDRVVETLGADLVEGRLLPGTVLLTEDLESRFGVSRSVAREAVRVLRSLGMVTSVKSVGIRVLPRDDWHHLDPTVISWRLAGPERADQLRSLGELRRAVEPLAAELAARRATPEEAEELADLATEMTRLGDEGDVAGFLELDVHFHRLIIAASGNEMLIPMADMIEAILRGRTEHGLQPVHPHPDALRWHREVATAIAAGDSTAAATASRSIVSRTISEVTRKPPTPDVAS